MRQPLDLPGVLLITAGLLLLVFGISRGGEAGWNQVSIGTLVAGLVLLAGFVGWEARARDPLLPVTIFRSPSVIAATITVLAFYTAVISILFFTPLYMQQVLGYAPFQSGLALVPMGVVVGIAAPTSAMLLGRLGQRRLTIIGLVVQALGVLWFLRTGLDSSYWADIMPGFVLMGAGQGFAYSAFTAASLTGVPEQQHGVAGAFNITAQQIGAAVGTAALVTVATSTSHGQGSAAANTLHGYHLAYLTSVGVSVVAIIALMCIRGFGRPESTQSV
ncbi:MFS transporter [Streptomyces sp. NPDC001852]|uniref:MFS transporter n=1 Tax=Streptomyces sp. NPDC001852 TaxID=3364619 RepID=UPI00369D6994